MPPSSAVPDLPTVDLLCHPAAPAPAVRAIRVAVGLTAAGGLTLAYRLEGDLKALRIPAPGPGGPADGLWQHTCFEAFVAAGDGPAYREFNFSPSGQWAAYAFSDYRQRDESASPAAAPRLAVRRLPGRLDVDAVLAPALLPPAPAGYRLGLSAVIEGADGARSYWALAHPAPQPDFHQRAAFRLDLAAPDQDT